MRMAYNKNASPAAQAKRTLHGLIECEPFELGWNIDLKPRVPVFTVMIFAARESSRRLCWGRRGGLRYGVRRTHRDALRRERYESATQRLADDAKERELRDQRGANAIGVAHDWRARRLSIR